MRPAYEEAKRNIEIKLVVQKCLGRIDGLTADAWLEAIDCLDDFDIAELLQLAQEYPMKKVASLTLKFLCKRSYPFRELIKYGTDVEFQQRMGLAASFDD